MVDCAAFQPSITVLVPKHSITKCCQSSQQQTQDVTYLAQRLFQKILPAPTSVFTNISG